MDLWTQIRSPQFLFLAGLALLCFVLLSRARRYFRQAAMAAPVPSQPRPAEHGAAQAADVNRWEVETHDLVREQTARLDNKMSVLQRLLRETAEATARLESLLTEARARSRDESSAALRVDPPTATPVAPPTPHQAEALASIAAARPPRATRPDGEPSRRDEQRAEIYSLADEGHSAAAISYRVGRPIGEVELILSLRT